jgi:hypothetical protein
MIWLGGLASGREFREKCGFVLAKPAGGSVPAAQLDLQRRLVLASDAAGLVFLSGDEITIPAADMALAAIKDVWRALATA